MFYSAIHHQPSQRNTIWFAWRHWHAATWAVWRGSRGGMLM